MPRNKYRLSVPLSKEIYEQVLAEANVIGVSAPTHAAYLIGNHIATKLSVMNGLNDTIKKGIQDAQKQRSNE